jgi:transposase
MDEFSRRDQLIEELKQQIAPQNLKYSLEQIKQPQITIETNPWMEDEIYVADASSVKYSSRAINRGFIDLSTYKNTNMRKFWSSKIKTVFLLLLKYQQ